MDELSPVGWEIYGTDNVTPEKYWANINLATDYLETTAKMAILNHEDPMSKRVEVVHPAILIVQKSSDAWGRAPREKDEQDVNRLVRYFQEIELQQGSWYPILSEAISSLPSSERAKTCSRLPGILFNK